MFEGLSKEEVFAIGKSKGSKFSIIDSEEVHSLYNVVGNVTAQASSMTYTVVPLVYKQESSTNIEYVKKLSDDHYCIAFPNGANRIVCFTKQIPAGKYKKLHIVAQTYGDGAQYKQCMLIFSKTCVITSYVGWQDNCMGNNASNKLRTTWLGSYQDLYPVEYLKNQTGVIQFTPGDDHIHFANQEIILDISAIKNDFYVAYYSCDMGMLIEDMWCD